MFKEPTKRNTLPPPLWTLSAQEVFIITGIPLQLCQGFVEGRFKPNESDHKIIARATVPFYSFNAYERDQFIQRKKYRTVKRFLNLRERKSFVRDSDDYGKRIDALVEKYWAQVVKHVTVAR